MKSSLRFIFAGLLFFSALSAVSAQRDTVQHTVFKTRTPAHFGVYIQGGGEVMALDRRPVFLVDFGFGMSINHRYRVGLALSFMVTNLDVDSTAMIPPYTRMRWEYNTYGISFDYTFFPNKIVSLNLGAVAGLGTISKHPMDAAILDSDDNVDDSRFFFFKPYVGAELNLTRFLSVGLGGGYRLAAGSATGGIDDSRLSYPYGSLSLKLDIGMR